MFSNEDVTIGVWMLAMNVNHENNQALCAPECTSTSIAVWDIPKCSGWCFFLLQQTKVPSSRECFSTYVNSSGINMLVFGDLKIAYLMKTLVRVS